MKKCFSGLVVLLMLIGISGCGAIHGMKYNPPQNGPTAKIKFINNTKGELKIGFFAISKNCEQRRFIPHTLAGDESAFTTIYAEKELTFEYGIAFSNGKQVHAFLRFTPKEGAEYTLESKPGQNASLVDSVLLERIDNQPAKSIKLNELDYKPGAPWDENGKFCKED
jgi:hypothetical protein